MTGRWLLALACSAGLALAPTVSAQAQPAAAATAPAKAPFGSSEVLRRAMRDELQRGLSGISLPDMPKPYYISAALTDHDLRQVSASLGSVQTSIQRRWRHLQVGVRVGDYDFDNSNFMGGGPPTWSSQIPFEDDYEVLRRACWLLIDASYKTATSAYEAKRARRADESQDDDRPPSFTRTQARQSVRDDALALSAQDAYVTLAKSLSAALRDVPEIQDSGVMIVASTSRRTFVTTEGSDVVEPRAVFSIVAWAVTQAADGMMLVDYETFHAPRYEALPSTEDMLAAVQAIGQRLRQARTAPVADNYSGPVLFEGIAAAQLIEHLFASHLSGTPPPETPMGASPEQNPLAGRVGWGVLPRGFSVVDDPGLDRFRGTALIGGYQFDDEGVPAERVELVRDGKLRQLLMSRTPSKEFKSSNGHGRSGFMGTVTGQVSNLVVRARGVSRRALRARLLREVRREGLPYGLVVRRLDDPIATAMAWARTREFRPGMGGSLPNPVLVYKVLPDGTEERLRGASLHSIQTDDLRDILAASRSVTVHQSGGLAAVAGLLGHSGMGSGVSIVAPDLLLRKASVRKPTAPHRKPPILPRPTLGRSRQ
jgi:TldD protein